MKNILIICVLFFIMGNAFTQSLQSLINDPDETYQSICAKMNAKFLEKKLKEAGEKEKKESRYSIETDDEFEKEEVLFRRWEWYAGRHLAPGGKRINEIRKNWDEYYSSRDANPQYFNNSIINGEWTELGPLNVTSSIINGVGIGRINTVLADPTNAAIIYAGSANGGLWKSVNSGVTWACLTDGLPRIGIAGIAINPLNTSIIYILTGDGDYGTCPSIGVLKSVDGGISWRTTDLIFSSYGFPNNVYGRKIIINPTSPDTLFAITDEGMYRTMNAGLSWTKLWSANMRDLEFNAAAPGIVYAVGNSVSAGNPTKLYRSINSGVNWDSTSFLGWPNNSFTTARLAVTPASSGYLYAYLGKVIDDHRNDSVAIYRSINNGASFTLMHTFPFGDFGQVGGDDAMLVSPTDANEVYLGCFQVWKSIDGGSSFNQISLHYVSPANNYIHPDIHDMTFAGGNIYVADDGGIHKSTDDGVTWSYSSTNLGIAQITHFGASQTNPDLFYLGSFDNGIIKYDNSFTGTLVKFGDGFHCAIDPYDSDIAYVDINGGQNKTTDGGVTWTWISDSAHLGFNDGMNPIIIDPSNTNILYGANKQLYKSVNGGNSWTNTPADSTSAYTSLALCYQKPSSVWGTTKYLVQRFDGTNWINATGNLPTLSDVFMPLQIAVHPTDSLTAWIAMSGYIWGNKVYKTTDGGTTWFNISTGLPNVPHNCIAYDEATGDLYVGNDIGVYFKNNTMTSWIPFMNGLPRVTITELYINYIYSTITAGTYGRGLWRSPMQSVCAASLHYVGGLSHVQTGYGNYESASYIHSSMAINHGFGDSIIYKANDEITLSPGFEASNGSVFRAFLGSCNVFIARTLNGSLLEYDLNESMENETSDYKFPELNNGLKLFPNPASESVHLSIDSQLGTVNAVYLNDVSGKVVRAFENINSYFNDFNFSVSGIDPGLYMVTVVSTNAKTTQQLAITNGR